MEGNDAKGSQDQGLVALCHGPGTCGCAGRETRIDTRNSQETAFVQHFALQSANPLHLAPQPALNLRHSFSDFVHTLSPHPVRTKTKNTAPRLVALLRRGLTQQSTHSLASPNHTLVMRRNTVLLALAASVSLVAAQDTAKTTAQTTAATAAPTTDKLTNVSSFVKSSSTSSAAASSTSNSKASSAASKTSGSSASNSNAAPTNLPTLAGATVPDMYIPFTADAPFMQKSTAPEGTIFIAVGACLAFLGACVLAWRAMVAWTINRSVKRAAMASVMPSDVKTKYGPGGNLYAMPGGSSLSLDALTSAGKPASSSPSKENRKSAQPKADPSSLFFSPTAGQRNSAYMPVNQNRSSTYLPAGYYATPSAQAAGGRDSMVMGGAPSLQPTVNRYSHAEYSPPSSRDGSRPRSSINPHSHQRTGSNALLNPTHTLYNQPSTSSLAVGFGAQEGSDISSNVPGPRAPSAYFDDVLQEHGHGPRDRY